MEDLPLRSLTYVSRATGRWSAEDIAVLGRDAAQLNALDGVSGLLVYNGHSFQQTMEGASTAVQDLIERIRRDPRHDAIVVTFDGTIEARRFPGWSMHAVTVGPVLEDSGKYLAHLAATDPDALFWRA